SSGHAIGSIWSTHQHAQVSRVQSSRAETVLVTRPQAEVKASVLPAGDAPFIAALLAGVTLGEAAGKAGTRRHGFDPGKALAGLISLGAISGLQIITQETFR